MGHQQLASLGAPLHDDVARMEVGDRLWRAAVDWIDLRLPLRVPRDDTRPVWRNGQRPPRRHVDRCAFGRKAPRWTTGDVLDVALRALSDLLAEGDDVIRIQPAGIVEHD